MKNLGFHIILRTNHIEGIYIYIYIENSSQWADWFASCLLFAILGVLKMSCIDGYWWFAEQTTPKVISEKAAARAAVCVEQLGSVRYVYAYRKCKKKGIIFAEPMSQTDKSLI